MFSVLSSPDVIVRSPVRVGPPVCIFATLAASPKSIIKFLIFPDEGIISRLVVAGVSISKSKLPDTIPIKFTA